MPWEHLDWNRTSKKILTVLLAIYPSKTLKLKGLNLFLLMIHAELKLWDSTASFVWKATAYSHPTITSNTLSKSLHTRMGLSFQLPKKTQAALEKIKQTVYSKDPGKRH
ncbi:hypothetical protein VP01_15290g1 [Puccinia sorghi]|uniref:Uncharacterized protein n=1 Tax=Puccinia sorghi TaxID=27349 RepID=A0A0L6VJ80_9BASI|nr:hypothetical protein VP01_15290g1 [Puccinia sorghi]